LSKAGIQVRLARKAGWLVAAKICLALFTIVFAASITVTTTNHNAEVGSVLSVSNNLLVTSVSYSQASSTMSATSCSSPISFSATPQIANTSIVQGHWLYDVRVNSTASTATNTAFNVTFVLDSTTYGPVCIKSGPSVGNNWIIDCRFDVGSALPASPYSYKVTV
jgi:hypothetical protein